MNAIKEVIHNTLYMFHYSWKISKRRFFSAGLEILFNVVEPFVYLIFPMYIVNELSGAKRWNTILFFVGTFIGSILILRAFRTLLSVFMNMSVNRCGVKNGINHAQRYMIMDYPKLEDANIRDMQTKAASNVHANVFVQYLSDLVTSLIKLLGFSYILTMLDPIMLIIVFLVICLNNLINNYKAKNEYIYKPIQANYTRKFDYLYEIATNFDYAKEIRVNNSNQLILGKFDKLLSSFCVENTKYLSKDKLYNYALNFISLILTLFSYGYTAYCALMSQITIGEFSLYISAIYNLSGTFNDIVTQILNIKYLSNHVNDYKEYIRLTTPQNINNEVHLFPPENNQYPMFEFENVSFTYPNTKKTVLKNINIKISKGEKLAIVGLNGAGKTTFIKLLCRLYSPTSGTIKCNGIDISTIRKDEYYRQLAVVFQDFKIFSFSFLDNIILNQPVDPEMLLKSIENAGLETRLDSLPNGVDTNIYKDFDEEGVEFSGGEAQKLAIARAIYKGADMIIFDEPTAAFDAVAEQEIYENYKNIAAGKTSIFISHRLSSTRFCDKIAVFDSGEIVEYGNHNDLMEQNGLYNNMFCKQAFYYIEHEGVNGN